MYKVMIVDDERIVRIALKTIIPWEQYGFEIIGGASEGHAALSLIEENCPDVLFTDLKMPGMDGIELIKNIKERKYKCKIIVLSNYGEFELVKEAMRLGVYDYLLKLTLKTDEFIQMMCKLARELSEEKEKEGKRVVENIKLDKSRQAGRTLFFREVLTGSLTGWQEIYEKADLMGIQFDPGSYYLLYIIIDKSIITDEWRDDNNRSLLAFAVSNIVSEILGQKKVPEVVEISPDKLVAIVAENQSSKASEMIYQKAVNISRSVNTYLNIKIDIVISKPFNAFHEISRSFNECKDYANMRFYKSVDSIVRVDGSLKPETPGKFVNAWAKTLENIGRCLEIGDKNNLYHEINSYLSRAARENMDTSELKEKTLNLVKELNHYIFTTDKYKIPDPVLEGELMEAQNLEQFHAAFNKIINDMEIKVEEEKDLRHRKEITFIVDYMEKNYWDKINLSRLARQVNLNESYLCRVFKKETGKSIINYLNDIRMEKAGELLKQSQVTVKEVAASVGIGDPFYFSKIFSKYYGISPTEYKNKVLSK